MNVVHFARDRAFGEISRVEHGVGSGRTDDRACVDVGNELDPDDQVRGADVG